MCKLFWPEESTKSTQEKNCARGDDRYVLNLPTARTSANNMEWIPIRAIKAVAKLHRVNPALVLCAATTERNLGRHDGKGNRGAGRPVSGIL